VTIPIPSSDIRDWPKFRLADSPALLERLGEGDIDFYDALTFEWIECPILYAHAVKTDGYLLLRRTGIECEDFDTKFALATRKGDSSSRSYISNVRQSVATKTKRKGKGRALELDDGESEGEVQIISDISTSFVAPFQVLFTYSFQLAQLRRSSKSQVLGVRHPSG
jgi:hypothetical protein